VPGFEGAPEDAIVISERLGGILTVRIESPLRRLAREKEEKKQERD
jgi:hypothetical protein